MLAPPLVELGVALQPGDNLALGQRLCLSSVEQAKPILTLEPGGFHNQVRFNLNPLRIYLGHLALAIFTKS